MLGSKNTSTYAKKNPLTRKKREGKRGLPMKHCN
jgi:hypothetical protein